jgi:hypothetical protein
MVRALRRVATETQLQAAGVTDDETAWSLLDPAKSAQLNALIVATGGDKARLLRAFTRGSIEIGDDYGFSRMELSWFDYVRWTALLCVVGLLLLLIWHWCSGKVEQRVVAVNDLAAFVPVRDKDLKLDRGKPDSHEFKSMAELKSRYPLVDIKKGAVLDESTLSAGPWDAASTGSLMEVPLKSGWHFGGSRFPIIARLVASPRRPTPNEDAVRLVVTIMGVRSVDHTSVAWVSISGTNPDRVKAFEAALGTSDVYAEIVPSR